MKITFRQLAEKDLPDRVRWFNDPEVARYFGPQVRSGTTIAKQRKWLKNLKDQDDRMDFIITVDSKPVGSMGLIEINKVDKNAGLYIFIGEKNFWGTGVAVDALKFLADKTFKKLKLHKLWLHVYSPNARAIRCYEKFGFKTEAHLPEMVLLDGKYHDEIFMSLTNPGGKL